MDSFESRDARLPAPLSTGTSSARGRTQGGGCTGVLMSLLVKTIELLMCPLCVYFLVKNWVGETINILGRIIKDG